MYRHKYTYEEQIFMKAYVPGHNYKEIQRKFTDTFGWKISTNQIKSYIGNHHLNTGLNGRYEKGRVPENKGKKMDSKVYEKVKETMFQKGHSPINHKPVGSERITKDGYIEVKVAEPNKWKLKHRVMWEEHRGEIPRNSIIIFVDGDKQNVTLDNLRLIERGTHAVINHNGLNKFNGEFKDTAIAIAELKRKISTCKRKNS